MSCRGYRFFCVSPSLAPGGAGEAAGCLSWSYAMNVHSAPRCRLWASVSAVLQRSCGRWALGKPRSALVLICAMNPTSQPWGHPRAPLGWQCGFTVAIRTKTFWASSGFHTVLAKLTHDGKQAWSRKFLHRERSCNGDHQYGQAPRPPWEPQLATYTINTWGNTGTHHKHQYDSQSRPRERWVPPVGAL